MTRELLTLGEADWPGDRPGSTASIRALVEAYDPKAVLGEIGGLMTLPANGSRFLRLRSVAQAAGSVPWAPGRPAPGRRRIEGWCNGDEVSRINADEDPPEFPFTEPLESDGRVYCVIGPQREEMVYRTSRLLSALGRLEGVDKGVAASWLRLAAAVLEIAEATAHRAGLGVGVDPPVSTRVVVVHPVRDRSLWTHEELDALLRAVGLQASDLGPLLVPAGTADATAERGSLANAGIGFVAFPDGDLVVLAANVLAALCHHLVEEVRRAGASDALAAAFAAEVEDDVRQSLTMLRLSRMPMPPIAGATRTHRFSALSSRADVLVLLDLVSDPLFGTDPGMVVQQCNMGSVAELEDASREAVEWAQAQLAPGQSLLLLRVASLLPGRYGRWAVAAPKSADVLVALPGAVGALAALEQGDPLALAKFARSLQDLESRSRVLAFNALDAYALYRKHAHSFYLSDDGPLDGLYFTSDLGLGPRLEALRRLDLQSIPMRGFGHVPVVARHPDERAPLYFVPPGWLPGQALVVRARGLDMWVLSPRRSEIGREAMGLYADLMDAVAYWLWQAAPHVLACLGTTGPRQVSFFVQVEDPADWASTTAEPDETSCGAVPEDDGEAIRVWLLPSFATAALGPDNRAERWLLAELAGALLRVLGHPPTRDEVMEIVAAAAPLGQKKMITMLPRNAAPELADAAMLPAWPRIDEWTDARVLDDLGAALFDAGRRPAKPSDREAQVALINEAVGLLFERLEREVAELAPNGLVEALILRNEALIREGRWRPIWTPTRVACFGEHSDIASRIPDETRQLSTASVSNRFLLEYVAARPPAGEALLTAWRYDRLLAIAASIVNYAFASDITKYELGDTDARILPSGRLGLRRDTFYASMDAYMTSMTPSVIKDAQESFGTTWAEHDGGPVPAEVDPAFVAEFGYTLAEFGGVVSAIIDLVPDGEAVAAAPRSRLVRQAAAAASVSESTAAAVVNSLLLSPRADFNVPPPGFTAQDVRPWLFNRRLSFVRRPLVARGDTEDPEIVWGWRGLLTAARRTISLIFEGRLYHTTKEMRAIIDRQVQLASREFVASAARVVEGQGIGTRQNVSKFGRLRLVEAGRDLGDIDVLGIDAGRRVLWAIECKNLAIAKTPHEVYSEIRDLENPKDGMIVKHQRRTDWMRRHMDEILTALGLEGEWSVECLIVVATGIASPFVRPTAIPVIPFRHLGERLSTNAYPSAGRAPSRRG